MPTPGPFPGTVYISSADAGPGAPFSQIVCPETGAEIKAEDIQGPVAALLANDEVIQQQIVDFPTETVNFTKGINVSNSVANGDAIGAIGNGVGSGINATGGTADGSGGVFLGGSSNGYGIEAIGTGTGFGASIAGGANGVGAQISAGGGNNHGLDVYATGTGHAIRAQAGNIQLNGSEPVASADPGQHVLSAAHYPKAWCVAHLDGVGGSFIADNINVASIAVTATYIEITWARAMATAQYAPVVTAEYNGAQFIVGAFVKGAQTTVKTRIHFADVFAGVLIDPSATDFWFTLNVDGRD